MNKKAKTITNKSMQIIKDVDIEIQKRKIKQKIADAKYYAQNKEKVKKRVAGYYQKNKERISEYKKKWYQERKKEKNN